MEPGPTFLLLVVITLLFVGRSHSLQLIISPSKTTSSQSRIILCAPLSQQQHSTIERVTLLSEDSIIVDNSTTCNNIRSNSNKSSNNKHRTELGTSFAQKYAQLEEFKDINGHCLVPKRYKDNPSLGNWVNKQRQNYRRYLKGEKTSMNEKRISALSNIGFVWDATSLPTKATTDDAWHSKYNQLLQFHESNGHCNVPSTSPLGQWIVRQRYLYRQSPSVKSSLTADRIGLLNQLDFQWLTRSEQIWNTRMNELREFKEANGHVMVPTNYPKNKPLSSWVSTQRKKYNNGSLARERIKELEQMGFVWRYWDNVNGGSWPNNDEESKRAVDAAAEFVNQLESLSVE